MRILWFLAFMLTLLLGVFVLAYKTAWQQCDQAGGVLINNQCISRELLKESA